MNPETIQRCLQLLFSSMTDGQEFPWSKRNGSCREVGLSAHKELQDVSFLAHSGLSSAEPEEITDPTEGIHFMLTSPFPYKYRKTAAKTIKSKKQHKLVEARQE